MGQMSSHESPKTIFTNAFISAWFMASMFFLVCFIQNDPALVQKAFSNYSQISNFHASWIQLQWCLAWKYKKLTLSIDCIENSKQLYLKLSSVQDSCQLHTKFLHLSTAPYCIQTKAFHFIFQASVTSVFWFTPKEATCTASTAWRSAGTA